MNRVKLFCIPYAGGSATVYYKWNNYLKNNIELIPVELSGHGARFNEKLHTNMKSMIEDIYNNIKDKLNDGPYMIFGHSMGALIAYELLYKIKESGDNSPLHAFFSGKGAPSIKNKTSIYNESDEVIIKEIYDLGGTPKELLNQKEILNIFLKIIRADYEIIETQFPNHAKEIAQQYTALDDVCLYAVGGDGTIFEVMNGINDQVPLAIIPCGTGNDFYRVISLLGSHFYISDYTPYGFNTTNFLIFCIVECCSICSCLSEHNSWSAGNRAGELFCCGTATVIIFNVITYHKF